MIKTGYQGLGVQNTGMSHALLDPDPKGFKLENEKYAFNRKEMGALPASARALAIGFTQKDGVTFLYEKAEDGKNKTKFSILWDAEENPIQIKELVVKRKKEVYVNVPIDEFKKRFGLEDGINRQLLSIISKMMIKKSLENSGEIVLRANNRELLSPIMTDGITVQTNNNQITNVNITEENAKVVFTALQAIYSSLDVAEKTGLLEHINATFKSEQMVAQKNTILKALEAGSLQNLKIGSYVKMVPASFAALEEDTAKIENENYKKYVEFVKSVIGSDGLTARTNLGGDISVYIPSIQETASISLEVIPKKSSFHLREKFSSSIHQDLKALEPLRKEAVRNAEKIPALKKAYSAILKEIEELDSRGMAKLRGKVNKAEKEGKLASKYVFNMIATDGILKEQVAEDVGYKELYNLKETQTDKRAILASSGIPYKTAQQIKNGSVDSPVVAFLSSAEDVKKKNNDKSTDIIHTTNYVIGAIMSEHGYTVLQKGKTLAQKLSSQVQNLSKMDNDGKFQYQAKNNDGEKVIKEKVVNVADAVEKIIKLLDEDIPKRSKKGVLDAMETLKSSLVKAMSSETVIQSVKEVVSNKEAVYTPLVEAAESVNILSLIGDSTKNYTASRYANVVNANMKTIYDAFKEQKFEKVDYFQINPKQADKKERVRDYKNATSLLASIISAVEFATKEAEKLVIDGSKTERGVQYIEYCKRENKTPSKNAFFYMTPKIKELIDVMQVAENKIAGRVVNSNAAHIVNVAESFALKDGKKISNGTEYDTKVPCTFSEMEKNLKEIIQSFIARVQESPSQVGSIMEGIAQRAKDKKSQEISTIQEIFASEEQNVKVTEKTETEEVAAIEVAKEEVVTPEAEAVQEKPVEVHQEVKEVEEIEESKEQTQEAGTEAEVAFDPMEDDIPQDLDEDISFLLDENEDIDLFDLSEEADNVFGADEDIEVDSAYKI